MKKLYQLVLILFVFGFLCMPMVKHLITGDKLISKENRNLAQKPIFPKNISSATAYTAKFDDYLADQFGFRRVFIKTANRLRYNLFDETSSKQITVGKNGYIFLNSHSDISPYSLINRVCDINPYLVSHQNNAIEQYNQFIQNYNLMGFQTGIAIIPTKSRIYPENLLSPQATICESNVDTWLDKRVAEVNAGLGVYYPLENFRRYKKSFPVYLSSYFHWNGELAYLTSDDMLKNYWGIQSDFDPIISNTEVKSDLSRFLQGVKLTNYTKKYSYKDLGVETCKGQHCFKNLVKAYKRLAGFKFYRYKKVNHRSLLLLSDSFGAEISEHFIRGFDEVNLINISRLTLLEQKYFFETILEEINPTHLLLLVHDFGFIDFGSRLGDLLK